MNKIEYAKWEDDARRALSGKYRVSEIEIILSWFRRIKGVDEQLLVGKDAHEAMSILVRAQDNFDMYNSMMARLFIYAPLILENYNE